MNTKEKLECLRSVCTKPNGAMTLLENYGFSINMPVDIWGLLGTLQIFYKTWDFYKIEHSDAYSDEVIRKGVIVGAVALNDTKICLFVSDTCTQQEQRWVLAFLFAYSILYMNGTENKSFILYKTEILPNSTTMRDVWHLASELVMPETVVRYVHTNLIVRLFSAFLKMFDVPDYVVRTRLKYLHLKCDKNI